MRWQCHYCIKQFSKPLSLSKHISEKHPYQEESLPKDIIENGQPTMYNDILRSASSINQVIINILLEPIKN